ncbi:MAG: DUF418 domain-containing protein [Pseudomonadota bacterium]
MKRLTAIDFLRGLALLGMLVSNIPWLVGDSMSRVHDPDVTSVAAWLLQYLVFDQRFLPTFCMLFGASLYLQWPGERPSPAFRKYHLRRMAALLLLGIAHAYLLWPGDILITYAVCGPLLLLVFRRRPSELIAIGISLKVIGLAIGEWPQIYFSTLDKLLVSWWLDVGPAPSTIVEAYAGSYLGLFEYNVWRNQFLQWAALPYFRIWDALGFMMIGMGLYQLGVLQGMRSREFYRRLLRSTLLLGMPLVVYGILARIGANETVGPYLGFTTELPLRNITFRTGCAVVSLSIIAMVHLGYGHLSQRVKRLVEALGRMPLTTYLFHSVFFFVVFHTFKLLAFDALDHDSMLLLVVLVSAIQLILCPWWLRRFGGGPIEAIWHGMSGPRPRPARARDRSETTGQH